jgi:hypothetical protein
MPTRTAERPAILPPPVPAPDRPARHAAGGQRPAQPSPWLARSLARTRARSRLEGHVRAIIVDLLGGSQPGELPNDCTEWLAAAVDAAVKPICDTSLAALTETLDAELASAPPEVARRLREAGARHDAGLF